MEAIKLNGVGGVTTGTVNPTETAKSDDVKATETQSDALNGSANASEQSENTQETEAEPQASGTTKHVVTYIGGGNWIDEKGKKWSKQAVVGTDIESAREYTDAEYQVREDLKFMVGYGAMTLVTVTL